MTKQGLQKKITSCLVDNRQVLGRPSETNQILDCLLIFGFLQTMGVIKNNELGQYLSSGVSRARVLSQLIDQNHLDFHTQGSHHNN